MNCKKCGNVLNINDRFCSECGFPANLQSIQQSQNVSSIAQEGNDFNQISQLNGVDNSVNQNSINGDSQVLGGVNSGVQLDGVSVLPNQNDVNDFDEKTNKSNHIFVFIIILLIIVSLLLGGAYFYLNNKKRVVTGLINSLYNGFEKMYSGSDYDFTKDSFVLTGDLSLDTNIDELSLLNGEKLGYKLGFDYSNKKFELGASLDENGSNIIDGSIYGLDNSVFCSIKDVFDDLVKVGDYNFDEIFNSSDMNYSKDDIKYVLKAYKNIFINSLNMDDFHESNGTINIDDKDVRVKKLSYELTEQRMKVLVSNMIDGILGDSRLLEILSGMTDTSIESLQDSLVQFKSSDINYLNGSSISFDVYTKGFNNSFVGMDIGGIIQIRKNQNNMSINIGVASQSVNVVITKMGENSYDIILTSNVNGSNIKVDLSISNNSSNDKLYNGSMSLSADVDGQSLGIKNNYTVSIGDKIADIDVSGAKEQDDFSEADLEMIQSNLYSKLLDSNIYNFFNGTYGKSLSNIYENQVEDEIVKYGRDVELSYTQYQYEKLLSSDINKYGSSEPIANSIKINLDDSVLYLVVDTIHDDVICTGENTILNDELNLRNCVISGESTVYDYSNGSVIRK
jgi:hypothetical protein